MLIKKNDIGGEIISILTRGMYLDPKDALREYIQNGVDAQASKISIKVRQDLIVIHDNGLGMDRETMRKSVRVGISEKSPSKNVGFMGIGIYSSFHLCDELHIYSKNNHTHPNLLSFNFKGMREYLKLQREKRFANTITDDEIIALQDLLEKNIEFVNLNNNDFPRVGTRVEMKGIDSTFFKTLSQFQEVASYLEQVVPLPFNPKFSKGKEIQSVINQICKDHGASFSLINMELQINEQKQQLYRPYLDEYFDPQPLDPVFYPLKSKNEFYGVAWGCLNYAKKTIKSELRGFITKKQGFTIGNRNDLLTYFGRQTFYNRYIGEIIVVHKKLLPNASRSEFEYTPLRIGYQSSLKLMANHYNDFANTYQEEGKANEVFNEAINYLREKKAQYEFFIDDSEELLSIMWYSKEYAKSIRKRKAKNLFNEENKIKAEELIKQLEFFAKEIKELIEQKKTKSKKKSVAGKSESDLADDVNKIPDKTDTGPQESFESLLQIFDSVGIEVSKELSLIIELIDENYIRYISNNNEDYKKRLIKLKNDFEELLEE